MTNDELAKEIERSMQYESGYEGNEFITRNERIGNNLAKLVPQIIAALRRECQPLGEMVMVPREPTDAIIWAICAHSDSCSHCPHEIQTPGYGPGIQGCRAIAEGQYHAALAAAKAEGRDDARR